MIKDDEQLEKGVVSCIKAVARQCTEQDITLDSDPIHDLGCDSADGLDFACAIEENLGICIPDEVNPFVEDNPFKRPRKIREIVELIAAIKKGGI